MSWNDLPLIEGSQGIQHQWIKTSCGWLLADWNVNAIKILTSLLSLRKAMLLPSMDVYMVARL